MHVATSIAFAFCAVIVQPTYLKDRAPYLKNEDDCSEYHPRIFILTDGYLFYPDRDNDEAVFPYGTSVKIWCQCYGVYAAGLLMKDHQNLLSAKTEDETSITWSPGKLDLQKRTEYTCTVKETVCKDTLFISVTPALDVISSNGQYADYNHANFTIEYGGSLLVMCSGPNASGLVLMKDGKQLPTEHVNISTINWFEDKPDLQISTYVCIDVGTGYNRSAVIKVLPVIYKAGIFSDFYLHDRTYNYMVTYKDNASVFCSGPRAVKFMRLKNDNIEVFTENLNETTIKLAIKSLKLGISVFSCFDSEFPDYISTVRVTIKPRILFTSPNLRCNNGQCVTKAGESFEIICSGPDAAELSIHYHGAKELAQTINATAIKLFIDKLELRENNYVDWYSCSTGEVTSSVGIEVLPHPEATDFHCISYNLKYLNCTWSTKSNRNNFTLSYIENGLPIRIYEKSESWFFPSKHRFCVWDAAYFPSYPSHVAELYFIMQSCNILGCFNQTFHVDHLSILKLDPPAQLGISRATSRDVELSWSAASIKHSGENLKSKNGDFYYRVEYWYPEIEPLEVNSSLVVCYTVSCFIALTLPCSDQSYEFRVYQKLKRAVGEEFWSNPTSVAFYVEGENNKTNIDKPACKKGPRKTKDVMIYLVQTFREEVLADKSTINEEVSSLQKKLDMLRKYKSDNKI